MKEMKMIMGLLNLELIYLKIMAFWESTLANTILKKNKMFKFVDILVARIKNNNIKVELEKQCTVLLVIASLTQAFLFTKCTLKWGKVGARSSEILKRKNLQLGSILVAGMREKGTWL